MRHSPATDCLPTSCTSCCVHRSKTSHLSVHVSTRLPSVSDVIFQCDVCPNHWRCHADTTASLPRHSLAARLQEYPQPSTNISSHSIHECRQRPHAAVTDKISRPTLSGPQTDKPPKYTPPHSSKRSSPRHPEAPALPLSCIYESENCG
jgi:hypothetical protein